MEGMESIDDITVFAFIHQLIARVSQMLINLSYFQLCLFVIDGTDGTSGGGKAPAFHRLDGFG